MVVPSIRPEGMARFLEAWNSLFEKHDVSLFVIEDADDLWVNPSALADTTSISRPALPPWMPTATDMIRSWGFYQAWAKGSEYTLTLDDDVRPGVTDPFEQYEQVFRDGAVSSRFFDVGALTTSDQQMRGFPYKDRKRVPVAVQYGGWDGVLDYDAATQLSQQPHDHHHFTHFGAISVPRGVPVTTCIMNCAFRTDFTPAMWQLPMIDGKYNRFGDIWSGLFQKRVIDALGQAMVLNNRAVVRHERASNVIANLEREQSGVYYNESLADIVFDDSLGLESEDGLVDMYRTLTSWVSAFFPADYREHFIWARDEWLGLFA